MSRSTGTTPARPRHERDYSLFGGSGLNSQPGLPLEQYPRVRFSSEEEDNGDQLGALDDQFFSR